jgi:DNA polymerase III epsilon subunit-like protein
MNMLADLNDPTHRHLKPLKKQSLLTKPLLGTGGDTIVFDLETNGLLNDATRIHCISLHWGDLDEIHSFNDEKYADNAKDLPMGTNYSITTALGFLEGADTIVGHNIIGFDIPVIQKFYPWFDPRGTVIDTLLLSKLYHQNLFDIDKSKNWPHMPLQLYGRHSLEAYGYRLGEYKGEFSKTTDWKEWSQEMQDYCEQDVAVTKKLCDHFRPYLAGSKWSTR